MKRSKNFTVNLDGADIQLYFKRPNHEETTIIDMEYRKMYSMAVRQGILTEAEAKKQFRKSGAWSEDDENMLFTLQAEIVQKEQKLQQGVKDKVQEKELDDLVLELAKLRNKFLDRINEKTDLFESTAESMADKQKMHKFIELCLRKTEDSSAFFENRESYETFVEEHHVLLSQFYKEAYFFEYGIPDDLSADWGEVKYLKQKSEDAQKKVDELKSKKSSKARKKKEKNQVVGGK
jgi:hypothetical protein